MCGISHEERTIDKMESLSEQIMFKEKEMFVQYLVEHKSTIHKEWSNAIILHEEDPLKERILENVLRMYALILDLMKGSLFKEKLKRMANEVANERLDAKKNIGSFVNNMNVGRSIIVKYVFKSNLPSYDLEPVINDINNLFDTFNYYAVTRFTNLKNKEIEEKDLFINENYKDKLVLLGQISSSFIHEFRNPLTTIIGFNKLLQEENPTLKYLDIMDNELQQLNFRIAQFLHTSRAEFNMDQKENVFIKELLNEIEQLTYPSIVDVSIHTEFSIPSGFCVSASKKEIKRVLLNLFINSIEALRHTDQPRRLKVLSYTTSDEQVITVSNNGPAITNESIKYIFEPFFTTKELGTGIGLYVCKRIIERYEGYMKCTSNNDLTAFSIHFPIHE